MISLPHVVRAEGLEPPRLSPLEPKSSASTNSATPAEGNYGRFWRRNPARLNAPKPAKARRNRANFGGRGLCVIGHTYLKLWIFWLFSTPVGELAEQAPIDPRQDVRQVLGNQPQS